MSPTNPIRQKLHDLRANGMKVKVRSDGENIRIEVTDDRPYPVFTGLMAHFMEYDFDEETR